MYSWQRAEFAMLEKKSVLAIVVTYHPDSSFAERFERVRGQVNGLLVVDNHSSSAAVSMLREVAARLDMDLILNSENLGVAAALNIGVRQAIEKGYEWALLFDQDTVPGSNIVEGLREAYDDFPRKDKLAIIGANYSEAGTGMLRFPLLGRDGHSWKKRTVVITSGSLLSVPLYGVIGPFRDEYFIDCVDLEYCLRARSKGFEIIRTGKPLMVHGIGQTSRHRLPWREIETSNHAGIRRYYMIRNSIDLTKKYLLREPAWVLANLWTRLKSLLVLCIFEEGRRAKIMYSVMGVLDGVTSRFDRKLTDKDHGNFAVAGPPSV